jgi:poly(3-hydroxybutyrate) depolymerase
MTSTPRSVVRAALLAAVVATSPSHSAAQALPGLLSLGVRHTTLKNTTRPDSALRLRIDSIDVAIAQATRTGRTAEVRRLYAKAATLLGRRPWTPESDYAASLRLRTEQQVVDPAHRWLVRLEQSYEPEITLTRPLRARAELRQRIPGARADAPLRVVREIAEFDAVPSDLRDTPLHIGTRLDGVADGSYVVAVEVIDSARTLATATLPIVVRSGLGALEARLEAAAARVAEPIRSDLLFAVERLRNVNASRLALGTFDPLVAFAAAESVLVRVERGEDPWSGRTGDLRRHYRLEPADEIMPYRLYVPTGYRPSTAMPLIVALHGLGGTENDFFEFYERRLPALAEERGYIIAAPLGYRVDGGYGFPLVASVEPAVVRARELSEADVLGMLDAVRSQYRIDASRVFLMGHSMGAIGTWALAARYPDRWAALGAFAGFGSPATARTIATIPQYIVHGDADPTVSVSGSRTMVAALRQAGAVVEYIEVPGGDHSNVVAPHLPGMFDFFDRVRAGGTPR